MKEFRITLQSSSVQNEFEVFIREEDSVDILNDNIRQSSQNQQMLYEGENLEKKLVNHHTKRHNLLSNAGI